MDKWYKHGLKFACQKCGHCCTFKGGYVWVTKEEIREMAETLNLSVKNFGKQYLRKINGFYSLIEKISGDCIMYKDDKCLLYEKRPMQCRIFPFWKENINTPKSWENAKKNCPGIDKTILFTQEQINKQAELDK